MFFTFILLFKIILLKVIKMLLLTEISLILKQKKILTPINSEDLQNFAKKNYNTYVAHCEDRKLKPMLFQEFLKNYAI